MLNMYLLMFPSPTTILHTSRPYTIAAAGKSIRLPASQIAGCYSLMPWSQGIPIAG